MSGLTIEVKDDTNTKGWSVVIDCESHLGLDKVVETAVDKSISYEADVRVCRLGVTAKYVLAVIYYKPREVK